MRIVSCREEGIKEEIWIEMVDLNKDVVSIHEFEKSKIKSYNYAILKVGKKVYGRLLWDWEKREVGIEVQSKYLSEIYQALQEIANDLDGRFFINSKTVFDSNKHLPIPNIEIKRNRKYFESDDLDYIRWMAFREEDRTAILKALKLEESKEVNLKDGVACCEIIVTPTYSGWTFIIGDDLPNLLIKGNESSSEEALKNLCKTLQKLSKKFIEVQYFEHQGKSNITGYFKANNGKLNFGYWESETEEFSKGRIPKEIKKLHPTSAHEIASVWSIDTMDFIYLQEMAEKESSVVVLI